MDLASPGGEPGFEIVFNLDLLGIFARDGPLGRIGERLGGGREQAHRDGHHNKEQIFHNAFSRLTVSGSDPVCRHGQPGVPGWIQSVR